MQEVQSMEFSGKGLEPFQVTNFEDVTGFQIPDRFGVVDQTIDLLDNGLLIRIKKYQSPVDVEFSMHSTPAFHIHAIDLQNAVAFHTPKNKQNYCNKHMNLVLEKDCTKYTLSAGKMVSTSISFTPEILENAQQITQVVLDQYIRGFIAGGSNFTAGVKYLSMSRAAQQVIWQIQNPPYEDLGLKKLYLEAKAQEWMVHILAILNQCKTGRLKKSTLTRADTLRAYEAEERLLANLSNPPSLSVLANAVGTNEKKLNESFKHVFGMTVFAWLREQRLQKAMELLEARQKNIQQIATYCGYKYQSDFSKAFKQRFGIPPSAV